jgi:hypothetical protein
MLNRNTESRRKHLPMLAGHVHLTVWWTDLKAARHKSTELDNVAPPIALLNSMELPDERAARG